MILAFDTSTSHLAIALADDDGNVLQEYHGEASATERGIHDARLAFETERMLREVQSSAREIARIGLVLGPGSFTGLRIGLSFAKGLAFANDSEIAGFTQHEVMKAASSVDAEYIITPGYQPHHVYLAQASNPRNIRLMAMSEFVEMPIAGTLAHPLVLATGTGHAGHWIIISPNIASLARLTAQSIILCEGTALDSLEPLYITEFTPKLTPVI